MVIQKPNLFIVGAAKAGTTSLWAALKTHPQVFMAGDDFTNKEPSYFIEDYGIDSLDQYLSLFSGSQGLKVIGEASAGYLSASKSASKIHGFNPHAKILICLRNPVDRAYSLYCWMVQEGYEWISVFENAILKESVRKHRSIPNLFERQFRDDFMYFSSGLYSCQVKKFLDLFGKNVKVIIFEDLIANPEIVLNECLDFLEIDRVPIELKKENPSVAVRSAKLQWFLRLLDDYKMRINHKWCRTFFIEFGHKKSRPVKISSTSRERLSSLYKDDIALLEELIDKDLSIWLG